MLQHLHRCSSKAFREPQTLSLGSESSHVTTLASSLAVVIPNCISPRVSTVLSLPTDRLLRLRLRCYPRSRLYCNHSACPNSQAPRIPRQVLAHRSPAPALIPTHPSRTRTHHPLNLRQRAQPSNLHAHLTSARNPISLLQRSSRAMRTLCPRSPLSNAQRNACTACISRAPRISTTTGMAATTSTPAPIRTRGPASATPPTRPAVTSATAQPSPKPCSVRRPSGSRNPNSPKKPSRT